MVVGGAARPLVLTFGREQVFSLTGSWLAACGAIDRDQLVQVLRVVSDRMGQPPRVAPVVPASSGSGSGPPEVDEGEDPRPGWLISLAVEVQGSCARAGCPELAGHVLGIALSSLSGPVRESIASLPRVYHALGVDSSDAQDGEA